MRVKLALRRAEGIVTNLAVTADATATIGDIAERLYAADPLRARGGLPHGLTLQLEMEGTASGRVLPREANLLDSGLRSGAAVSIVQVSDTYQAPSEGRAAAAAIVRVVAGPDAGREFPVPVGTSYLGRAPDMDIRLTDPMVSKRHARVTVGDVIEFTDANSANGLVSGGEKVARVVVSHSDELLVGDTVLKATLLGRAGAATPGPAVEFNRSPRVLRRYPQRTLQGPGAPRPPRPARFPWLAMIAPLIMGAVMFAVTKSAMSVVFVALSPLLMAGTFLDAKLTARREHRAELAQFDASLAGMATTIEREHAVERATRLADVPSVAQAVEAVRDLGVMLWTHRPEHAGFLSVRLGVGRAPSRLSVDLPGEQNTEPAHWARLRELGDQAAWIDDVPLVGDLRVAGAVGIAGRREAALPVAAGVMVQAVAYHSPAEVVVCLLASATSAPAWQWLEWTPHTSSPHSPLAGDHVAGSPGAAQGLLSRLEELVDQRLAQGGEKPAARGALDERELGDSPAAGPLPAVVVLVEDDAPVDRGRLTRLAERGPDAGVYVMWVASSVGALPAACRTFLAVDDTGMGGTVGQVREGLHTYPVACEPVAADVVAALARRLAPMVDAGSPVSDQSDLPRSISYLSIAGPELADNPGALIERWRENFSLVPRDGSAPVRRRHAGTLRALVGHAGAEPFYLDLRTQGPHALVGGTTGSGKSEFLQAWVLGMAAAYSPDRVTFLFVDYKGGAAFADCVHLPHTVGLVTDLSPHLVRRALTSLRAELRYREHLLNRKKAKDLVELERSGDPECPPSLLIVVDEFAALVGEVPEFVDGVVDVAQRGRSLGLHLILATQRPAGVIKDNLRANTNLRVALRMADEDDSSDVLGLPLAAHFDPSIPGRGAAKTGPGRVVPFQTGYAGGWTQMGPERPQIDIVEMNCGSGAVWEAPEEVEAHPAEQGPNDIARCVATITGAARAAEVPEPRKPWLAELAPVYDFSRLPNPRTDVQLLLGVLDEPATQSQPTVFYEPDRDGNMAIFGTGGSGKSTALRTVAVSAAVTPRGGPVQVYGIDCAAGGLRMLEELPHVGSIVQGEDTERVVRLLRMLRDTVDERAQRYAKARAATIAEYRTLAGKPDEPRIVLLVDGLGAFRESYEYSGQSKWFTAFSQIAADGRQVGVHVVVTGDRPSAVPPSLASTIQRRLVLRLASEDDYTMMGVPKDVLSATSPPGRGILDDNEVQLAVFGGSSNVAVQSREIAKLAASMRRQHIAPTPPIGSLPDAVPLAALADPAVPGAFTLGLDDVTLAPLGVTARGTYLLAGTPGSGRTSALATIALSLRRSAAATTLLLYSPRRSALADLDVWDEICADPDAISTSAQKLCARLEGEMQTSGRVAVLIEGITELTGTGAEQAVDQLVRTAVRTDQFIVGESESSTWSQAWTLAGPFKAGRRGLVLVPGDMDTDTLLGTSAGRFRRADFPPGRGFHVEGGVARKVQVALPQ